MGGAASLPNAAPLSPEMAQCYNQWSSTPTQYAAQYDSAPSAAATAFIQTVQNNPAMLTQPQPNTVPVTNPGLIGTIFGLLNQGATQYQQYQLGLAKAKMGNQTAFVDPNLVKQAQAKSNVNWTLIIGAGVGLVAVVGLVAYMARKD
jgi:hypothetical protein